MTCKDCIHYDVCESVSWRDKNCQYYMDKSKIIELPCKVGDTVYRIKEDTQEVVDWWEVEHIEIYGDETVFIDDSDNIFTLDDIGKRIFLTRELAEEALKREQERL